MRTQTISTKNMRQGCVRMRNLGDRASGPAVPNREDLARTSKNALLFLMLIDS